MASTLPTGDLPGTVRLLVLVLVLLLLQEGLRLLHGTLLLCHG